MGIRKVKKLIGLPEESGIDELETCEGEGSVRTNRHSKTVAQPVYTQTPAFAAPVATPAPATAAPAAVAAESALATPKLNGNVVRSPMVDTFYRVASPASANFVEINQDTKKGDTLYIVEVMKIMSHIEAEVSGTIKSILVENGQPIGFSQPLFTIV